MTPIGRRGHRGLASIRVAVVLATVAAIGLNACSSGSSKATTQTRPSTTGASTTGATATRATGPSVIIDTDLSRWWDDVTALGMANVLQQQGALNVLGIVSDIPNPLAVAAIDAIDTAYGHADIPLGAVAGSDADTAQHGYSDVLAERLPHTVRSSADVPEAVEVYRQLLARQPDGSVTIVA